jgi:hypothetical protein
MVLCLFGCLIEFDCDDTGFAACNSWIHDRVFIAHLALFAVARVHARNIGSPTNRHRAWVYRHVMAPCVVQCGRRLHNGTHRVRWRSGEAASVANDFGWDSLRR